MKIHFIKRGLFSYTNISIRDLLVREFPTHALNEIDVVDHVLRKSPASVGWNLLHIFRLYRQRVKFNRGSFQDHFYNTPFIFHMLRRALLRRLDPAECAFTFQTQSLFDASLPGVPHFLYTDHTNLANSWYGKFGENKLMAPEWHELEKQAYQNATRVFTMSQHVARSVVEHYGVPAHRVVCVHAGSNALADPVPLNNNGYRNKEILFIGKEWERKGGPVLVEAFREVLRTHPDAHLSIVGCSPDLNIPNCSVLGRQPIEDVKRYFAKASVFCMPTRVEPFGIVFLEAMLNKIPVVAPNTGALPDFVQNGINGFLVEPENPTQTAEAICQLLSDPEKCSNFGERGQQIVKTHYTWDAVGCRIREEIMSALDDCKK